ncbi:MULTISPECIES: helix-turn-helix domain-containing protein [Mycobacteriaceae]|uniref:Helix-turn-helix domain protein n=1 Tax=Mycobacteroides salmoniphilum TaxID=404941 RepID=A0A4R8SVD7_9MYCO|nr:MULTISPECIES: helix-turn-helix domain-containing protein [Mycobacteriaceae]TEA06277.1 Helix-turn-helix domain protein [Mycobacteroides salmoniphilum]
MKPPSQYLTENCELIIPPEFALWLQNYAGINGDVRLRVRMNDPDKFSFLQALQFAAQFATLAASGTKLAGVQGNATDLKVTTTMAAHETGRSERCVRHWCRTGRLRATKQGRDWVINRADLEIFLAEQ